jgi:hypothetical protein
MSLPGFMAEYSLYKTTVDYQLARRADGVNSPSAQTAVRPQAWTVPNLCTWNLFCCIEYRDQRCCEWFFRRCVPE